MARHHRMYTEDELDRQHTDGSRREFLRLTAGAALASSLAPVAAVSQVTADPHQNWSKTYRFHTDRIFQPSTDLEAAKALRAAGHARAIGTRHSFNGIADSTSAQVSTLALKDIEIMPETHTVRVGAGVRLGELAEVLDRKGWALHNLPSLPHISAGGCVATATHGSGLKNPNLSAAVRSLEIVGADGQAHIFTRDADKELFPALVVSLGCFGVNTHLSLDIQPRYDMAQTVYQDLSFDQVLAHLPEIMGSAYSVSLFTHWNRHRAEQVWVKQRLGPGTQQQAQVSFFGAARAKRKLHPAGLDVDPAPCTEQGGVPGPWHERLPHFRLAFTPSSGHEIQTEYFVAFDQGAQAIKAIEALHPEITPHLIVTELRTIAADDLWLSMAYQRRSLAIHFTWKPEAEAVLAVLPRIEQALQPFQPRPHWAKVFAMSAPLLAGVYPRFEDFRRLVQQHDPHAVFRNDFTREKLNL